MAVFDTDDVFSRQLTLVESTPLTRIGIPSTPEFYGDAVAQKAWEESLIAMGLAVVEIDFSPFRHVAEMLYGGPFVAGRLTFQHL